jgi:enamine deaminase RidA (YjgF/YER057c/UK114 family)
MTITRANPEGLPAWPGLSQVVTVTDRTLVYLSGQVATDAEGRTVGSTHVEQARQVKKNIDIALAAAGATRADIVKETVYVVGYRPELLPLITEALGEPGAPLPASTLIPVPMLYAEDALFEVDIVAAIQK